MNCFAGAGHSRLVVYDDMLDDAVGMIHLRDLVGFMTERAAASAKANTRRKRPFPAGLDLKAIDLSTTLSAAKIVREMLFGPHGSPALALYTEDHELAASTLAAKGFTLFTEGDIEDDNA